MKKAFVFLLAFLLGCSVAWAQTVSGKHAEKGVTCVNCHGEAAPAKRAPVSACAKCHGDYAGIAKLTEKVTPNPHASHQGEVRCTLCHKTHEPSKLYCNECHQFDLKVR